MLDLKYLVENNEEAIKKLGKRNTSFNHLKELVPLNEQRKNLSIQVENLKAKRNEASKKIGLYKQEKKDTTSLFSEVQNIGDTIKKLDKELNDVNEKIVKIIEVIPNFPADDTPIGINEDENKVVEIIGELPKFNFPIRDHIDLGNTLDILDFERAAKIAGARFVIYKGLGARLERALINFMIDTHAKNNYTEIIPPYLINYKSLYATSQFPKFKDESFKIDNQDLYLNPTAEVPTINMYRDEIVDYKQLPLSYCSYTTAFRSEAGSAGRDTKGILRQHQFNKVELIKISKPEDSYKDLHIMLKSAKSILDLLKLPYRVVELCTGDLGFAACKTFDIEVWIPSQNTYREISSVSNDEDFQARRGNIRFKRSLDAKTEYVHTLNGSGLAIGRTVIAILENYQNEDGSITLPEVLIPYMNTKIIKKDCPK